MSNQIQLRFIDHHPEHVDPIVGPFRSLEFHGPNLFDSYTGTQVASYDEVNDCWFLAPGWDPSHTPETYQDYIIEYVVE